VLVRANRDRPAVDQLTLRSPSDLVCHVLELAGLTTSFRIDPRGHTGG
jgi:hypothetical protein